MRQRERRFVRLVSIRAHMMMRAATAATHGRIGRLLELVDEGLEEFFRAAGKLSATDVDISFEAPNREWSAKLTRPTVNMFLTDIRRSADRGSSGVRMVVRDGRRVHQPALPVVDLRYVITAWTHDPSDERSLLGAITFALLKYGTLSHAYLDARLAHLEEPTLLMARSGEDHMDVFKAVDGQIKPGVNMVVSTEFDIDSFEPAGPPTEVIGIRTGRRDGVDTPTTTSTSTVETRRVAGHIVDAERRGAIGALVHCGDTSTLVNPAGQFLIRAAPGGQVVVDLDPPLIAVVPDAGGIVFESTTSPGGSGS